MDEPQGELRGHLSYHPWRPPDPPFEGRYSAPGFEGGCLAIERTHSVKLNAGNLKWLYSVYKKDPMTFARFGEQDLDPLLREELLVCLAHSAEADKPDRRGWGLILLVFLLTNLYYLPYLINWAVNGNWEAHPATAKLIRELFVALLCLLGLGIWLFLPSVFSVFWQQSGQEYNRGNLGGALLLLVAGALVVLILLGLLDGIPRLVK